MNSQEKTYDVVIVGAGVSGTALLYVLSKYTDIPRVALIEKYAEAGSVNSNAVNNSQTLHVGEIETNYSVEKTKQVYPASMMIKRYTDSLPEEAKNNIIQQVQKIVLAVGEEETAVLTKRYPALKEIFPSLQILDGQGITQIEPAVMHGRDPKQKVCALFNPEGYAVNYGLLAGSFVERTASHQGVDTLFNTTVTEIDPTANGYTVHTNNGTLHSRVVVFDTDAYSLGFAKKLGYGKEFSLIPIAGNFYFTPQRLNGKVYRVQNPRMPFAAVHGDPELTQENVTRWGPTARFYPALEASKGDTTLEFFQSSGFGRIQTWVSFISILLDPTRFWFLFKNFFYDLPLIGKYFMLPQLKLIVPKMKASDISPAKGYGGMRLQRVNTETRELLLGEGKIIGKNIIFNMTPSPGASVCLHNAMRDTEQVTLFLEEYTFNKKQMLADLCISEAPLSSDDVSLKDTYPS